ncbi:hypothetical protein [Actinomadura spongiicola]|uniref:hypothetical protein n=1 Tax=Actinomadura spongiicola TaxID=2303421 RepID=UPI0011C1CCEA|nr:hypothetical protein [Actinomadura spongiicola]
MLIGLWVAVLLPDSLPQVRRSFLFRVVFAGLYSVWVLAPSLAWWKVVALTLLAMFWCCALRVWEKIVDGNSQNAAPDRLFGIRIYLVRMVTRTRRELGFAVSWMRRQGSSPHRRSVASALILAALTLLLLEISIDFELTPGSVLSKINNRSLIIVLSGFLAATFVSHEIVARIYARFDTGAPRTRSEILAFSETYAYIGWFERALVFAFVAGGQAAAAALVIAAKSLARHPEIEKERKFGERFIIGTFLSVLFGVLWAVIVRVALDLKPM